MRKLITLMLLLAAARAGAVLRVVELRKPLSFTVSNRTRSEMGRKYLELDVPANTVSIIYAISTYKSAAATNDGMQLLKQVKEIATEKIDSGTINQIGGKVKSSFNDGIINCLIIPDAKNSQKFKNDGKFTAAEGFSRRDFSGGAISVPITPSDFEGKVFFGFENTSAQPTPLTFEAVAIVDVYENISAIPIDTNLHIIMPSFIGDVNQYLSQNLRYPEEARDNGITGRVGIKFIVETDGQIDSLEIVKSAGRALDGEAIRVVKKMPPWKPATKDGVPIKAHFTLPITFRLE